MELHTLPCRRHSALFEIVFIFVIFGLISWCIYLVYLTFLGKFYLCLNLVGIVWLIWEARKAPYLV